MPNEGTYGNIVVADDTIDHLRLIVDILSRNRYNVRPAIDGEAALASIQADTPDLILLDSRMPKMDGFEVYRCLKSSPPLETIPVIFVSASVHIDDKIKAFSMGAVDYITKPYEPQEVLARVATHLSVSLMKREIDAQNALLTEEIAERKKIAVALALAKEKAEIAGRSKTKFFSNMSHELRTPLNHIIGFSEILADQHFGPLNSTQRDYLQDILASGRRLLSLLQNILDISEIEIEKLNLIPTTNHFKTVLGNSMEMIQHRAKQRGLKLSRSIGELPGPITADFRLLKHVLYSLLDNAVNFSKKGSEIEIGAKPFENTDNIACDFGICVSITNTEAKLTEDEQKEIFRSLSTPPICTIARNIKLQE